LNSFIADVKAVNIKLINATCDNMMVRAKVAGSCHGGSSTGTYEFIKQVGFVPFDTCMPYLACSSESTEGFCSEIDTTCSPINTCRTCNTFSSRGGTCTEIAIFPNATIKEYGTYNIFSMNKVHKIKAEIFARGPVSAGVNAEPLVNYKGGVVQDNNFFHKLINHIVSIVGWDFDPTTGVEYWIVRNSWGQYWGENGYFRIELGKDTLGIESEIAWATPDTWTEHNFACDEDGKNCETGSQSFTDPSEDLSVIERRLKVSK